MFKEIDPHCRILDQGREVCKEATSLTFRLPLGDVYQVHRDCIHNQRLAAVNRVICNWPQPHPIAINRLRRLAYKLSNHLGRHRPLDPRDWLGKYTGQKKKRYDAALASLQCRPIRRQDGFVNAFVKREKVLDVTKDPRMIQARSARYNIELGNFLKAFEHDMYEIKGVGHLAKWFGPTPVIMKCRNQRARAILIERKWNSLKQPVQLQLDCSRFDAHCSEQLLAVEHLVYVNSVHKPYRRFLSQLLSYQLTNKCYTKDGLKYTCPGRRMSGDMNTALGNCVLMILMLVDALKQMHVPVSDYQLADDGDDCSLFVEKKWENHVTRFLPHVFLTYGHELKVEGVVRELHEVKLCANGLVTVGDLKMMVLNPRRAIGKSGVITRLTYCRLKSDHPAVKRQLATIGQCLLAIHSGVPVLQSHALYLMKLSRARLKFLPGTYTYRLAHLGYDKVMACERAVITLAARQSFADAFGIDIHQQLFYEHLYEKNPNDMFRSMYSNEY